MFADGPSLNGQYTVIGEVVSGMDVVDKLKRGEPVRRSRQDGEGASRIRHQVRPWVARSKPSVWFAARCCCGLRRRRRRRPSRSGSTPSGKSRQGCKPAGDRRRPRAPARIDITVMVSFNRKGAILGQPKDHLRIRKRQRQRPDCVPIAVMETLQRCTPLPFTEGLGGAVAGRPFAIQFQNPKTSTKPKRKEHG